MMSSPQHGPRALPPPIVDGSWRVRRLAWLSVRSLRRSQASSASHRHLLARRLLLGLLRPASPSVPGHLIRAAFLFPASALVLTRGSYAIQKKPITLTSLCG